MMVDLGQGSVRSEYDAAAVYIGIGGGGGGGGGCCDIVPCSCYYVSCILFFRFLFLVFLFRPVGESGGVF